MAQRSLLDVLSEKQCGALGVFLSSCKHADLEELFAQTDMQQVALLLDLFVINQSEGEEGIDEATASELKTDSAGPVTSASSWPAFQPTKPVLSAAASVFVPSVSAPVFKPSLSPSATVFTPSAPAPAQPAKLSYVGIVKDMAVAEATSVPVQAQPAFVPTIQIQQATKRAPPGKSSPQAPVSQRLEFKPALMHVFLL